MYNRTFKKNTQYEIANAIDGDVKVTGLDNQRKCKNYIYSKCNREEQYIVTEYYMDKKTKKTIIIKQWIYKFTKEGLIFTKEIYSLLTEIKLREEKSQLNLFINY